MPMKSRFLLLFITLAIYSLGVKADVVIDDNNFPDENFRSYISSTIDKDKDGKLSDEEITAVKEIMVDRRDITTLKGIEFLTALTYLDCSYNQLTALYLSMNTALTELYCYKNKLDAAAIETIISNLSTIEEGYFAPVMLPAEETNTLPTKEQVAAAKAKGWTTLYNDGSSWEAYEGVSTGIGKVVGDIKWDENAPIYNTKGHRVGKNYKGVIIYKGKKILKK